MVISLLLVLALGAIAFGGYRFTLHLYSLDTVSTASYAGSRREEAVAIEGLPIEIAQRMAKRERDDGLRIARIGLFVSLSVVALLLVVGISALFHI